MGDSSSDGGLNESNKSKGEGKWTDCSSALEVEQNGIRGQ